MKCQLAVGFTYLLMSVPATSLSADDYPFGANGLPYLADFAEVIVQAGDGIELIESNSQERGSLPIPRSVFSVPIASQLKGRKEQDRIGVVITGLKPPRTDAALRGSIFFLGAKLSPEELKELRLPFDERRPLHLTLGGNKGIVSTRQKEVLPAINEFLATKSPVERIQWARDYSTTRVAFLQDSAIQQIWFSLESPPESQPELVNQMRSWIPELLSSPTVGRNNKMLCIAALSEDKTEESMANLNTIVMSDKLEKSLRSYAAVCAMGGPGWDNQLVEWSQMAEEKEDLKSVIEAVCNATSQLKEEDEQKPIREREPTEDEVRARVEQLDSKLPSKRLEAVRWATESRPTESLRKLLVDVAQNVDENPLIRSSAVRGLEKYSAEQSLEPLFQILADKDSKALHDDVLKTISNYRQPSGPWLQDLLRKCGVSDDDQKAIHRKWSAKGRDQPKK